jgi:hypothetical protein
MVFRIHVRGIKGFGGAGSEREPAPWGGPGKIQPFRLHRETPHGEEGLEAITSM